MPIIPYDNREPPQHDTLVNPNHRQGRPPKRNASTRPRKLLFVFLKCIIMALVLSLFLLFLGFAALILLHFLLTTTAFRRRHRRRERYTLRATETTFPPFSSPDLMDRLPCLNYSASAHTAKDCAICLDSFKDDELCRNLPDCSHLFHMKCVDSWLTKVPNCPICRTPVKLHSGGSDLSNDDWKTWWVVGV